MMATDAAESNSAVNCWLSSISLAAACLRSVMSSTARIESRPSPTMALLTDIDPANWRPSTRRKVASKLSIGASLRIISMNRPRSATSPHRFRLRVDAPVTDSGAWPTTFCQAALTSTIGKPCCGSNPCRWLPAESNTAIADGEALKIAFSVSSLDTFCANDSRNWRAIR